MLDRAPEPPRQQLRCVVLRSADEFDRIRTAFVRMRARAGSTLPFDSHRWLLAWWRAAESTGIRRSHRVITVWHADELVGALPVQVERGSFFKLPVSRATAMGAGWGANQLLVVPEYGSAVAEVLAGALDSTSVPRWQVMRIAAWRGDGEAPDAFVRALQDAGRTVRRTTATQPYLALAASWEQFQAAASRNFRRTIKRKLQAVAEAGLSPRFLRNPTPEAMRDIIVPVTERSWQGAAGLAPTATPFGRAFYDLLAAGEGEFDLDLVALEHEGLPIAFLLGIIADGVYHAFETGFDGRWAEQSPGLTLHFLVLERLHAERIGEFDFGHSHGYKDRFEPSLRNVTDLRVFSGAWLGHWEDASVRFKAWVAARRAPPVATPPADSRAPKQGSDLAMADR